MAIVGKRADERRQVMEVKEAELTRLTLRCGSLERMEREYHTLQGLAEQGRAKLQEVLIDTTRCHAYQIQC
jgi:hypothetical protein